MQPAEGTDAPDKSISPPARKKRGPQDDNVKSFVSSVGAGLSFRLAKCKVGVAPSFPRRRVSSPLFFAKRQERVDPTRLTSG